MTGLNIVRGLGVLILVYALGAPLAAALGVPLKTSPQFYEAAAIMGVIGAGMFGVTYLKNLVGLLPKKSDSGVITATVEPPRPDNLEELDMIYLFHLAERAKDAKDIEAVGLVKELQDHFYDIHHEIKDEKTSPNTKPGTTIIS